MKKEQFEKLHKCFVDLREAIALFPPCTFCNEIQPMHLYDSQLLDKISRFANVPVKKTEWSGGVYSTKRIVEIDGIEYFCLTKEHATKEDLLKEQIKEIQTKLERSEEERKQWKRMAEDAATEIRY